MSGGLFFSDTPGGLGGSRDAGFGAAPGKNGFNGVGIKAIDQVPNTYQVIVTLDDGRQEFVDLPPGPQGDAGVTPTFIAGNVTLVANGNAVLVFRPSDQPNTYFVDVTMPDPAGSVAAVAASASDAAASKTAAANSATAAGNSATAAVGSATAAANSATSASNSAASASTNALAAAAAFDAFDDRYLGAKNADPSLDNDGNALIVGAFYWATQASPQRFRVWTGSAFADGLLVTAGVSSFNGRSGAVVPASGDYTAAQVTGAVPGPSAPTANAIATFNADGSIKDSGAKFGTAANNAVQLDASARYPAADGSQITGIAQGRYSRAVILASSQTWVAPANIRGRVTTIGAGGGGGQARGNGLCVASGGGAGGMAVKLFSAAAGASFTASIGAAGTGTSNVTSGLAVNGSDGGNTTFSGGGLNLAANGGKGGPALFSSSGATTLATAGAAGGAATGGDVNYTGGGSGPATILAGSGASSAATGGGAVAFFGTAYRSGQVTIGGSGKGNCFASTGGAGIGGVSQDAVNSQTSSYMVGGGGSAFGAGQNFTFNNSSAYGGPNIFGQTAYSYQYYVAQGAFQTYSSPVRTSMLIFDFYGVGGMGNQAAGIEVNSDPGGGGGGNVATNGTSTGIAAGDGGLFGGGGGAAHGAGGALGGRGGVTIDQYGRYGGGGGGAASTVTTGGQQVRGGDGGAGLIIIEYDVVS